MAQSHGEHLHLDVSFRQGQSDLDPSFRKNAANMSAFRAGLDSITRDNLYRVRRIYIRASASPEGRYQLNQRLSTQRAASLQSYLQSLPGLQNVDYRVNVVGVDWQQMVEHIKERQDFEWRDEFLRIIEQVPEIEILADGTVLQRRRQALMAIDGAKPYLQIYDGFFHDMRGAQAEVSCVLLPVAPPRMDAFSYARAYTHEPAPAHAPAPVQTPGRETVGRNFRRRPLLAVKTNLLFDFAPFYPGYGWCPAPNVAVEFYPRRGRWTVGASLDCPWWKKPEEHRYFQVRNYQLELRRYFRNVTDADFAAGRTPFTGWFLSAYAHAGLFGIGLSENRGGQGEGAGAGLGFGYVLPLSRSGHWKLELSAQAGYSYAWYDRYVFGNPVTGLHNGLYYFNWTGNADDFVPRLYRRNWFGPTRVGLTISYDLLKRGKKEAGR